MSQPRRLPRLSRAEIEAVQRRLNRLNISPSARNMILQSLNAAANAESETVEFGIRSLSEFRQAQVFSIIDSVQSSFDESNTEFDESILDDIDSAVIEADEDGISLALVLALLALYQMSQPQYDSLYSTLLEGYSNGYQDGINAQLASFGVNARANSPSGRELRQLETWAREDANSIRDTFNREAENQLRQLHTRNPLGTSAYYRSAMETWRRNRQSYKSQQIALNTTQKGYGYGLQRFHEMNQLQTRYRLTGAPPVCPTCIDLFGRGLVSYDVVQQYPMPIHINCPHTWEAADTRFLDPNTVWRG